MEKVQKETANSVAGFCLTNAYIKIYDVFAPQKQCRVFHLCHYTNETNKQSIKHEH
jgi:hypothetical protein